MPQQHCVVALSRLNSSWVSLQSSQYCPAVESVYTLPKRSTAHSAELGMAAGAAEKLEVAGKGQCRIHSQLQARTTDGKMQSRQRMRGHPTNQRQGLASSLWKALFVLCLSVPLIAEISFKCIKKYREKNNLQISPSPNLMNVVILSHHLQIFHDKQINEESQIWLDPKYTCALLLPQEASAPQWEGAHPHAGPIGTFLYGFGRCDHTPARALCGPAGALWLCGREVRVLFSLSLCDHLPLFPIPFLLPFSIPVPFSLSFLFGRGWARQLLHSATGHSQAWG